MPSVPTSEARKMAQALDSGLRAARLSLERLFWPAEVHMDLIEGWPTALASSLSGEADDPQALHLGVAFDVKGPVKARLVLVAGPGQDTRLATALLRQNWSPDATLDHDGRAAFAEMANIVASSFLNGVARQLQLKLMPSVPSLDESPLESVVGAISGADDWAFGARFTIDLPSGRTSGLFVAAPEGTGNA